MKIRVSEDSLTCLAKDPNIQRLLWSYEQSLIKIRMRIDREREAGEFDREVLGSLYRMLKKETVVQLVRELDELTIDKVLLALGHTVLVPKEIRNSDYSDEFIGTRLQVDKRVRVFRLLYSL